MEVTFKYKGQIISTPKLEKKLKRMGITINDIKIIETPKKTVKEDNTKEFRTLKLRSSKSNLLHITYWPLNELIPVIEQLCEERGWIWNAETKTGSRMFTEDYIKTLHYEE